MDMLQCRPWPSLARCHFIFCKRYDFLDHYIREYLVHFELRQSIQFPWTMSSFSFNLRKLIQRTKRKHILLATATMFIPIRYRGNLTTRYRFHYSPWQAEGKDWLGRPPTGLKFGTIVSIVRGRQTLHPHDEPTTRCSGSCVVFCLNLWSDLMSYQSVGRYVRIDLLSDIAITSCAIESCSWVRLWRRCHVYWDLKDTPLNHCRSR